MYLQADRGGISIDTEKTDLQTTSKLTVAGVTYRDAGNYTCRPADARPAIVTLVVIEGNIQNFLLHDITAPKNIAIVLTLSENMNQF
jgi:hypothetical protein